MFRGWFGGQSKKLSRFERLSAGAKITGIIADLSAKSDELAKQTSAYFNKTARKEAVSEADQLSSTKGLAITLQLVQLDKLMKEVNQSNDVAGSQKELKHYLDILQKMQDGLAVFLGDYFEPLNQPRSQYRQYVPGAASGLLAWSGGSKYISKKDMPFIHGILHSFLSNIDIEEFSQIVRYLPGTPLLVAALIKEIVQHSESLLPTLEQKGSSAKALTETDVGDALSGRAAMIEELKQRSKQAKAECESSEAEGKKSTSSPS